MSVVRRSFFWSLLDNYIGVVLQLVSTLIVARLLTPSEIGIFAVAAVLGQMAMQFRDFGLGEYLIQEKQLTDQRIRAAFGLNMALSWTMAVLFFALSWEVAEFYRQPGIGEIMRWQTLNFLLVPFGGITMAYFRREMAYKPLFVAGLAASLSGFVVGLGGCLLGYSYLALAWGSLASLVATVAVSVWYRPPQLPRWPSLKGAMEVMHFSKHAMGIYFFGQIGKSAPEAVIGRALDVAAVAYYSRANGLMEIFNRTVLRASINLCLPYFAMEQREGKAASSGYLKATTLLTGVGWPFFAVMAVLAFSAIRLLYGDQWMSAVPLAQLLCLVAVLELPYWLATEVMIAAQRIDQSHRLQAMVQTLRVASLVLVIPFGLLGAGWGLALAAVAGAVLAQRALRQIIDLHFRDVLRACAPSLWVALLTAAPALVVTLFVPQGHHNFIAMALGCGLLSAGAWLAALRVVGHPFWHEVEIVAGRVLVRLKNRHNAA
jgi:O-antigen/teichoic acid export membrane protein